MKDRRHPLDKETFSEGVRQKFCLIFIAVGLLVMAGSGKGWIKDPSPYLTFFSTIGMVFIGGASATAALKVWKVDATAKAEWNTETKTENVHISQEFVDRTARPRDFETNDATV